MEISHNRPSEVESVVPDLPLCASAAWEAEPWVWSPFEWWVVTPVVMGLVMVVIEATLCSFHSCSWKNADYIR